MGQGSRWASVIYTLKESKWGKGHYGLLLFTPWQSETSSEQQEKQTTGSKWAKSLDELLLFTPWKSQNGGCCCLPPDRVKLIVTCKKETNSRVKMGNESKWAKGQDWLLFFTPWQSKTSSEQQENTNSRVKMGKKSKWAKGQDWLLFFTPWQSKTSSEQQENTNSRVKMGKKSKWAKGHDGLLLFTPLKESNEAKIIIGCCCLPPDRVKLAVNSKKETNSKVKIGKGSRWASVIYSLK